MSFADAVYGVPTKNHRGDKPKITADAVRVFLKKEEAKKAGSALNFLPKSAKKKLKARISDLENTVKQLKKSSESDSKVGDMRGGAIRHDAIKRMDAFLVNKLRERDEVVNARFSQLARDVKYAESDLKRQAARIDALQSRLADVEIDTHAALPRGAPSGRGGRGGGGGRRPPSTPKFNLPRVSEGAEHDEGDESGSDFDMSDIFGGEGDEDDAETRDPPSDVKGIPKDPAGAGETWSDVSTEQSTETTSQGERLAKADGANVSSSGPTAARALKAALLTAALAQVDAYTVLSGRASTAVIPSYVTMPGGDGTRALLSEVDVYCARGIDVRTSWEKTIQYAPGFGAKAQAQRDEQLSHAHACQAYQIASLSEAVQLGAQADGEMLAIASGLNDGLVDQARRQNWDSAMSSSGIAEVSAVLRGYAEYAKFREQEIFYASRELAARTEANTHRGRNIMQMMMNYGGDCPSGDSLSLEGEQTDFDLWTFAIGSTTYFGQTCDGPDVAAYSSGRVTFLPPTAELCRCKVTTMVTALAVETGDRDDLAYEEQCDCWDSTLSGFAWINITAAEEAIFEAPITEHSDRDRTEILRRKACEAYALFTAWSMGAPVSIPHADDFRIHDSYIGTFSGDPYVAILVDDQGVEVAPHQPTNPARSVVLTAHETTEYPCEKPLSGPKLTKCFALGDTDENGYLLNQTFVPTFVRDNSPPPPRLTPRQRRVVEDGRFFVSPGCHGPLIDVLRATDGLHDFAASNESSFTHLPRGAAGYYFSDPDAEASYANGRLIIVTPNDEIVDYASTTLGQVSEIPVHTTMGAQWPLMSLKLLDDYPPVTSEVARLIDEHRETVQSEKKRAREVVEHGCDKDAFSRTCVKHAFTSGAYLVATLLVTVCTSALVGYVVYRTCGKTPVFLGTIVSLFQRSDAFDAVFVGTTFTVLYSVCCVCAIGICAIRHVRGSRAQSVELERVRSETVGFDGACVSGNSRNEALYRGLVLSSTLSEVVIRRPDGTTPDDVACARDILTASRDGRNFFRAAGSFPLETLDAAAGVLARSGRFSALSSE